MQRWEYLTATFSTSVEGAPIPVRDDVPQDITTKYSPYALIPQLNQLGDQGWELVTIEPVVIGRNGDVVVPDAGSARWGRDYFCCFKRPIP